MKQLIFFVGTLLILLGCTAETAPPAPQSVDTNEPSSALSTVAPTETAVSPTANHTNTPEPEMNENESDAAVGEPVSPVEVDLGKLTPQPPADTFPVEKPRPGVPNATAELVSRMSQDLAERLSIDVQEITLEKIEEVVWPDGALGCPEPGMAYITVLTPGYQATLSANGEIYDYHAAENGFFVLCGANGKPVPKD